MIATKRSTDHGKTWPFKKLIYPRSAAYSSMAISDDGHLVCFFEGGPVDYRYSGIGIIRIPLIELSIK